MLLLGLAAGVLLGVGLALWLSHRSPASLLPFREPVGSFRVTREMDGRVEVLHQGAGAKAAQLYAYHNPTQAGEVIAFYRGAERCSAKAFRV